jgi:hypothetical protein
MKAEFCLALPNLSLVVVLLGIHSHPGSLPLETFA